MGEALAAAIIKRRETVGISERVLDKIRPLLTVGESAPSTVDVILERRSREA